MDPVLVNVFPISMQKWTLTFLHTCQFSFIRLRPLLSPCPHFCMAPLWSPRDPHSLEFGSLHLDIPCVPFPRPSLLCLVPPKAPGLFFSVFRGYSIYSSWIQAHWPSQEPLISRLYSLTKSRKTPAPSGCPITFLNWLIDWKVISHILSWGPV